MEKIDINSYYRALSDLCQEVLSDIRGVLYDLQDEGKNELIVGLGDLKIASQEVTRIYFQEVKSSHVTWDEVMFDTTISQHNLLCDEELMDLLAVAEWLNDNFAKE